MYIQDGYTRIATEVIIAALKDYRDPFLHCPRQNVRIRNWLTRGQGRTWCELIGIDHTVDRILNDNARARGAPGHLVKEIDFIDPVIIVAGNYTKVKKEVT